MKDERGWMKEEGIKKKDKKLKRKGRRKNDSFNTYFLSLYSMLL